MKLQIDIAMKTICVLDNVTIRDLIKALAQLFPEEAWMEYKLLQNNNQYTTWQNPIVIPCQNPTSPTTQPFPWIVGTTTVTTGTNLLSMAANGHISKSVYNVDLKTE